MAHCKGCLQPIFEPLKLGRVLIGKAWSAIARARYDWR